MPVLFLVACADDPLLLTDGSVHAKAYATPTALSGADAVITGHASSNRFGESIAFSDLDGDGHPDLVVGARSQNSGKGAAWVIWGDSLGDIDLSEWTGHTTSSIAGDVTLVRSNGYSNLDYFGWDVADLGDGTVAVSSPAGDYSSSVSRGAGYTHIFDGLHSGARLDDDETAASASDGEIIGGPIKAGSATTKCDYNGVAYGGEIGGTTQVAVGCPLEDKWGTYDGAIYFLDSDVSSLQSVRTDANLIIRGPEPTNQAQIGERGTYVIGDLDGDGDSDDAAIGCRMYEDPSDGRRYGAVFLVLDATDTSLWSGGIIDLETDYDYLLRGASLREGVGYRVELVPDMNADGADELLIAAPYEDTGALSAGGAWLVTGLPSTSEIELDTTTALLLKGEERSDKAGSSVLGHDFDFDGVGDLAIGAEKAKGQSGLTEGGRVYHLSGATLQADGYFDSSGLATGEVDLADADDVWGAEGSSFLTGIELGAADFDRDEDGTDDSAILAIGASQHNEQGRNTGAVYLVQVN